MPTIAIDPDPIAARETRAWQPTRNDSTISAPLPRPRSARRVAILVLALLLLVLSPVVAVLLFSHSTIAPSGADAGSRLDPGAPADASMRPRGPDGPLPGRRTPERVRLNARPPDSRQPGTLSVRSRPEATVYIDRVKVGSSPLDRFRLPAGEHELRLVSGGRGTTRQLLIKPGVHLDLGTLHLPRR